MKKRLLFLFLTFALGVMNMQIVMAQSGYALNMPGGSVTTSKMAIPPLSSLIAAYPFTVEMWVKPHAITAAGGFWVDRSGTDVSLQFTNDATGGLRNDIFGTTTNATVLAAVKPAINVWHHLSMIVRSDSVVIECDGKFYAAINAVTFAATFGTKFSHLGVDSSSTTSTRTVTGMFDEVRIWNTARTRAEILANKSVTLAGTETGLVAYYNFDNSDVNDKTANALNGKNTGGTFVDLKTISTLGNIAVSGGTMVPAFAPGTTSYTVYAPADVRSVVLTGTASAPGIALVTNNPATINASTPSVIMTCTSGDGLSTTNYTINFSQLTFADWNAKLFTGTQTFPNMWGWTNTSTAIPWQYANGSGGCRYRDYNVPGGQTGYTNESDGTTSTSRQLMLRFDNGAYSTSYYSYPVYLDACKTYDFSWDYVLGGSGTPPNTITIGIDTTKTGTGRLSSKTFTTTNSATIYRHGVYTFSTGSRSGIFYLTINAGAAAWYGVTNLALIENTTPIMNVAPASVTLNDMNLTAEITVTGNGLTNDITITAPAGINLSKSTIPAGETQCGSKVTLTFNNVTNVNDSIRLVSGSIYKAIPVTGLPTFKPSAGVKYYILQTTLASGKVVGETATLPALTYVDNLDAQKFEFIATATPNVYYLLNNAGQYLNYDGVSALVYSASTNSTNSEWKIEGGSIASLNLKNIASNGYLNSAAITSGSALTANGIIGGANIGMKLIPATDMISNGVIDGDFENAIADGSPLGTWIPNKTVNLGGSLTSRVNTFGGYQSTATKCFFMRYLGDATSYDTISNKLIGLESGATYNLDFRYKNNTVGDAFKINVYASSTANANMSATSGNVYTSSAVTDGSVTQPEQLGSMTFIAPSKSCYVVFAKNIATSNFNFYLDSMVITKKPAASLSNLTSGGAAVAGFSSSVLSYNIVLPAGTSVVPEVVGTATDGSATVNITPASALPGTTTILVTAIDGTTKITYAINYTVAISTDATLSDLKSGGTTVAGFAADVLTYDIELPNGTTVVPAVLATATFSKASIIVTPASILPGSTTVAVTAEDGVTTKTYTINYTVAKSTDATLSDLKSDGNTVIGFVANVISYNIELPLGTTTVPTVTATAADNKANIVITPASNLPGATTVVVTAEDGTTQKTYTINFTVAKSTDATLSDLTVSGITISGFASGTISYDVELAVGTTVVPVVTVTATNSKANAVVTPASNLPGATTVVVTAEDGTTQKTYTINFTVAKSTDATLSDLKIGGTTPADFASDVFSYESKLWTGITVPPAVSVTTKYAKANAVITQASGIPGTATVVVTAEDGTTKLTYTVNYSYSVRANVADNTSIKVYPTISRTNFYIETKGGKSVITIIDITGKVLSKEVVTSSAHALTIAKAGIYFINVENNGETRMVKVVKTN
jgi:type IV secretory pathway ATPase VirB11/archaellum biosynthesis ATPase